MAIIGRWGLIGPIRVIRSHLSAHVKHLEILLKMQIARPFLDALQDSPRSEEGVQGQRKSIQSNEYGDAGIRAHDRTP